MPNFLWIAAAAVAGLLFVLWIVRDDASAARPASVDATRRRLLRAADRRYRAMLANEPAGVLRMVDQFRAQDAGDMTMFVVALGEVRDEAFRIGIDLRDPLMTVGLDPGAPRALCAISVAREEMGDAAAAGAAMVWAATLRAGQNLALRQPCRDLWAQIARGFPHVRAKATPAPTFGFPTLGHVERDCFVPVGFDPVARD